METLKKMLLLDATGRTGKWVAKEAVKKSYEVNCLVRSPEKLPKGENINVFKGNAINPADLQKAIVGCGAVISALNISFKSKLAVVWLEFIQDVYVRCYEDIPAHCARAWHQARCCMHGNGR